MVIYCLSRDSLSLAQLSLEEKKIFLEKLKRDVEVMIGVPWEMTLLRFFASPWAAIHLQYEGTHPLPLGLSAYRGFGLP